MSLGTLLSNADCGPSNPLQQLSKRLDTDRGIQQDYFGVGRAGPSRAVFHQSQVADPSLHSEAAQFFQTAVPQAFDLNGLSAALPLQQTPTVANQPSKEAPWGLPTWAVQQHDAAVQGWATEFLAAEEQRVRSPIGIQVVQGPMLTAHVPQHSVVPMPLMASMPMRQQFNGVHMVPPVAQVVSLPQALSKVSWDEEFLALTQSLQQEPVTEHATPTEKLLDDNELARTAGMLIDAMKEETNPKFKNSAFLSFMRQVRDKEVVVKGNDMVRASEATTTTSSEAQSGSTSAAMHIGLQQQLVADMAQDPMALSHRRKSVHFASTQDEVASIYEDEEDAQWERENREYAAYWGEAEASEGVPSARLTVPPLQEQGLQGKEWDTLQRSWDQWEATATGVKRVYEYQFRENNPYLVGTSSTTRYHTAHNIAEQGILEHEAAVLRNPENAQAWLDLGVKQQANEREDKAIQALRRAVELDPSLLTAWLELAVSYTNEGHRSHAYDAIEGWIDRKEIYADAVRRWKASNASSSFKADRAQDLIGCLIEMARSMPGGAIDADVQIALGVLLNTSEEYDKARDCFEAALDVRPDDYLLYNRIGATIANGGHPEQAIHYYRRALELNPTYIRARFNLGISYITLHQYEEAADHILDALGLQEQDGLGDNRGVTPSVLWDSLRNVCNHLHRNDLVHLCDARDLNRFRAEFLQRDPI